jgi:hypothetical protein
VAPSGWRFAVAMAGAGPARIGLRPEAIRIDGAGAPAPAGGNHAAATIAAIAYHGAFTVFTCTLPTGEALSVLHPNREADGVQPQHRIGDPVGLVWPVAAAKVIR